MYYKVYHNISGSLTVNISTVTNITLTGVLAGYTYIITVVPINILGYGYPNKTIGYLNLHFYQVTNFTRYNYELYIIVAIPVSMFLSSLLTAVITTLIVYLIMRRRSYNKNTPPTTTTQLGPIYDDVKLPETSEQKEIIELQGNTAYGYIRH